MNFGFTWPLGLTSRHISQLLFGKRAGSLSEILPEVLEVAGAEWTLEECYAWLEDFEKACKASGVYILDPSSHPEEWKPPALPKVVKTSMYFSDPDLRNTPRLLKRYLGKKLPKDLTEDERSEALTALRQSPVYYQPCREEGCDQEVMVTLGQAGRSIEKFGLTADNPYQPSTRCKACRKAYETAKTEGRTSAKPVDDKEHKKKKTKGLTTIGEALKSKVKRNKEANA